MMGDIMNKEEYLNLINKKYNKNKNVRERLKEQINNFFDFQKLYKKSNKVKYNVGDKVILIKGTLLHGTYKNFEGLKKIASHGLIASNFLEDSLSKYPNCVGVWNIQKDCYLNEYIDYYSGGTIAYYDKYDIYTQVIPYSKMNKIIEYISNCKYRMWTIEQTKEVRFMPSLVSNNIQIGIILNGNNEYIEKIKNNDILSLNIDDKELKYYVNNKYYNDFIKLRLSKNDLFTNRESAILFGIPACFIDGVLVGREYENDKEILDKIKKILPNCYVCNLDGVVILN